MIEAVKTESSALDQMKEKLKEVDNLRGQVGMFSKKLLDADQVNLNMKTNILKLQESLAAMKKGKQEVCCAAKTFIVAPPSNTKTKYKI